MASLPSQHPSLALHLTDRALTPIISTSNGGNPDQQAALDALASTALAAHASALRLELGHPVRVMVEFEDNGPLVLSSLLDPEVMAQPAPLLNGSQDSAESQRTETTLVDIHTGAEHAEQSDGSHDSLHATPILVGVVVAPSGDHAPEARRATSRLERVGKQFQDALVEEQRQDHEGGGD
ncbi:hypothetical protein GQ53DRAFT_763723 [Thozetella sp. PMI_491]|nr:hypothetical protein GQ53DRAFT_763723 [Thozetella sp. PMI_491]